MGTIILPDCQLDAANLLAALGMHWEPWECTVRNSIAAPTPSCEPSFRCF